MSEQPLHDAPPIDRWRLDALLETPVKGKLWGLPSIAAFLGVSQDTARRWARHPEVPIYQPPGTRSYCAFQSELRSWQRSKRQD
ncbi:AlpA family transcriptional regulator [Paracoccus sp. PAMC 22219]|uniref:helix-turn-helix transcriptional regulator n=1 Tax=Paracoccus sp. PAMC 22219 TaxID=1569209 RepID=UPI0009E09C6D|nr:hypothetical protein [Paracoccus sp. PAMC 22219]